MLSSFLLTFRESLEAALIIGIILSHLVKIERKDLTKSVYIGALLGAVASIVVGIFSFSEAKEAAESTEELFQTVMMLLASGLIAYFILWLHKNQHASEHVNNVKKNASGI